MKRFITHKRRVDTKQTEHGFTLIETLVAIAILTMVLSGLMGLIYMSTMSGQQNVKSTIATYLAADGIEFIRWERDSFFLKHYSYKKNLINKWVHNSDISKCMGSTGCKVDTRIGYEKIADCSGDCPPLEFYKKSGGIGLYGYNTPGSKSKFTRKITISASDLDSNGTVDQVKVVSIVTWPKEYGYNPLGPEIGKVKLIDYLYAWYNGT